MRVRVKLLSFARTRGINNGLFRGKIARKALLVINIAGNQSDKAYSYWTHKKILRLSFMRLPVCALRV